MLVLDTAQLLHLESDYAYLGASFLSEAEEYSEPSKSKDLFVVLCFPQVEVSVLAIGS